MSIPPYASHIAYRLEEQTTMLESEDGVIVISPFARVTISHLSPHLRGVLMTLPRTACSTDWINTSLLEAHEESMFTSFYRYLSCLMRHQMVSLCAEGGDPGIPLATLTAISPYFQQKWATIEPEQLYQMSRFAYTRRDEDGSTYLESPLSHARLRLEHALAAHITYQLGKAMTLLELFQTLPGEDREHITGLLALLVMGNFASPTTPTGQLRTENDETFLHWDFHDLLFHSRSRMGRHANISGGTFRFLHHIPPQPAIKRPSWSVTIPLFRPDMARLRMTDPSLTVVLEERTSIREYGDQPITAAQLGEFLYRVAQVKEVYNCGETGEFTKRPYPNAGASYEIELYLTIEQCAGLAPGFYWYHPLDHTLSLIHETNNATKRLLFDAAQAMGGSGRPQVLLTLAARFQRVSWKYQSIAYSLILKNVGVMYATMYLVATAMDLAPCALGTGNADLFSRLAGSHYLQETSVGEFMLGSKPT